MMASQLKIWQVVQQRLRISSSCSGHHSTTHTMSNRKYPNDHRSAVRSSSTPKPDRIAATKTLKTTQNTMTGTISRSRSR